MLFLWRNNDYFATYKYRVVNQNIPKHTLGDIQHV